MKRDMVGISGHRTSLGGMGQNGADVRGGMVALGKVDQKGLSGVWSWGQVMMLVLLDSRLLGTKGHVGRTGSRRDSR